MSKLAPTKWTLYGEPYTEPDKVTLTIGHDEKPGDKTIETDSLKLSFEDAATALDNIVDAFDIENGAQLHELLSVFELINDLRNDDELREEIFEKAKIKAKLAASGKANDYTDDELQDLARRLYKYPGIPADNYNDALCEIAINADRLFREKERADARRDSPDDLSDDNC